MVGRDHLHLSVSVGEQQGLISGLGSSTSAEARRDTEGGSRQGLDDSEAGRGARMDDVDYDELDGEREEEIDFHSLGDFLHEMVETVKDTSHAEASHIKALERTLEDEKRRLAQMEVELRDARKAREAGEQAVVVQRQSKMLEGMVTALSQATQSELMVRQDWEEEWRERADELHRQHREMEEALRRRHAAELKKLQGVVAKDAKRTAVDIKNTRRANDPREMDRAQQDNLQKLVQMFHQHGQERLFLSAKISEQEEQLVRAKNLARQKLLAQSQSQSNPLYRQYSLPTVSVRHVAQDIGATGGSESPQSRTWGGRRSSAHSMPRSTRGLTSGGLLSRSPGLHSKSPVFRSAKSAGMSSTTPGSRATRPYGMKREPLPSPRLETGTGASTFLTSIEADEKDADPRDRRRAQAARNGGQGDESVAPLAQSRGGHHSHVDMHAPSQRDSQLSSPFGHPGMTPVHGGKTVASEFGDRAPPQLPHQEGRNAWDPHFAQTAPASKRWHPNVIAFESTIKKPRQASSPYEKSMVQEARSSPSAKGFSSSQSSKRPQGRSKSTQQPVYSQGKAAASAKSRMPGGAASTAKLPSIARGGRQHPTDFNNNRPLTDAAKNDDYEPSAQEKYFKLEQWIEDKIQHVLGGTASKDNFMSRAAASMAPSRTPAQQMASMATCASDPFSVSDRYGAESVFEGPKTVYSRDGSAIDSRGTRDSSMESPLAVAPENLVSDVGSVATVPRSREGSDDGADRMSELLSKVKVSNAQGMYIEGKMEALQHKEKLKADRGGTEIDQSAEEDEVEAPTEGKYTRSGQHVDLVESEDASERRDRFDKAKKKSISWNLAEGESRPETAATDDSGDPGSAQKKEAGRPSSTDNKDDFFSKIRHNKVPAVEEMVNDGFNINERDKHGNTPLMVAAQNGHKRLVKLFLRYGGDPNASNHQGNTALHFASAYGYSTLAQYLISKGADDTMINNKGLSVYDGLG